MSDKPILFSGPMVRALLAGNKAQTRRAIKLPEWATEIVYDAFHGWRFNSADHFESLKLRISPDDRLYVRESLTIKSNDQCVRWLGYAADGKDVWPLTQWRRERNSVPSIHMPRWASRLTLTVTDVRVERLQDISEADAQAEGAEAAGYIDESDIGCRSYVLGYAQLWNSINGLGSWEANPWVAAYTFTVQHGNIDGVAAV
jgi:hypothetical protein